MEGLDFAKNLAIPTIDFGTFHLYPASCECAVDGYLAMLTCLGGTSNEWGNRWVSSHGAACVNAGKPCMFEEYGVKSNHCSVMGQWQQTAVDTKGVAADLFWQYGDTLSTGKSPDDEHTIYYGTSEYQCLVTSRNI